MQKDIMHKLLKARARLAFSKFLDVSRHVLLYAGIISAVLIIAERLLAVELLTFWLKWSLFAFCSVVVLTWWFFKIPSKHTTSLLIDDKLKLKERMSSLMAFENSDDLFAQAASREATQAIEQVSLHKQFPISPSKDWIYSLGMWLMVIALVAFMPQYDLLGNLQQQEDQARQIQEIELAEKTIELTTNSVKMTVKQLGNEDLASELEALEAFSAQQSPEAVKRQTIEKLGNLSDKIKQMESGLNKESMEISKKMLKQLRPMTDAFSQKLQQALSKGDWSAARDMVKQFQQQLEQGQMTDQQKSQFSKQLENLSKQLEKIAAENKALQDELAKQGLDKELAKMSEKDIRKALENQGLTPEQIEQLMQKMSACQLAGKNCSALAKTMAACSNGASGLGADELSDLAAQLNDMESFEQKINMLQASLAEIENAMNCLGEGMCQGLGAKGPWQPGDSNRSGSGTGGPGRGLGQVDKATEGQTATKATKLQNQQREGQIVASWYFKGEQIKGESSKELDQLIQIAQDDVAEAITENQIPRRYEDSVKKYFGGLNEGSEP